MMTDDDQQNYLKHERRVRLNGIRNALFLVIGGLKLNIG